MCAPVRSAQDEAFQQNAKAKFISIAPGFVEWPASTFKAPDSPLEICIHGGFSFGITLAQLAQGAKFKGHRMEIKWARKEQDLPACQVLFVGRSAAKRYDKVFEAIRSSTTLTIGEDPDFLRAGGMVNLQGAGNGVVFDVNLDAVNEGHLKLSSQMLALARNVVHNAESAKN